jgi:hypothetical protein
METIRYLQPLGASALRPLILEKLTDACLFTRE